MTDRRGFLAALAIGAFGVGAPFAIGAALLRTVDVGQVTAVLPHLSGVFVAFAFGSGAFAGRLTGGRAPYLAVVATYGGGWAVLIWWSLPAVGFGALNALVLIAAILLVVASGGFAFGRSVRPRRAAPPGSPADTGQHGGTLLERVGLVVVIGAAFVASFGLAAFLKYLASVGGETVIDARLIYAPIALIAAGAWLSARRPAPRIAAGLAYAAAAFVVGSVGAAMFAPSYEPPRLSAGTLELRIESPFSGVVSGPSDCQSIPNGTDFALAQANPLTGLGQYAVQVTVSIHGGLSQGGPVRRDRLGLIIAERPPLGEVTVAEGSLGEFVADDSAVLSITTEGAGGHRGSMTFANLRQTKGDGAFGIPSRIVLSGAVSWSCDAPASP